MESQEITNLTRNSLVRTGLGVATLIGGLSVNDPIRQLVPFNQIAYNCFEATHQFVGCTLLTNDSAPDSLEAFLVTIGSFLVLSVGAEVGLLREETAASLAAAATLTAAITLEFCFFIEGSRPFNEADIASATLGTLGALFVLGTILGIKRYNSNKVEIDRPQD